MNKLWKAIFFGLGVLGIIWIFVPTNSVSVEEYAVYSAFLGEGHQSEQLFIHPRTVTIHDAHIVKEHFKDLMVSEEMIQRLLDVNRHSYTLDHKLTLGSPIGFSDNRGQSLSRVAFNSDRGEALFYIRGCKGMFVVKMVKQDNTWKIDQILQVAYIFC